MRAASPPASASDLIEQQQKRARREHKVVIRDMTHGHCYDFSSTLVCQWCTMMTSIESCLPWCEKNGINYVRGCHPLICCACFSTIPALTASDWLHTSGLGNQQWVGQGKLDNKQNSGPRGSGMAKPKRFTSSDNLYIIHIWSDDPDIFGGMTCLDISQVDATWERAWNSRSPERLPAKAFYMPLSVCIWIKLSHFSV